MYIEREKRLTEAVNILAVRANDDDIIIIDPSIKWDTINGNDIFHLRIS